MNSPLNLMNLGTEGQGQAEHFFTCPYCWETISILLDLSVTEQEYIEDCEVCCRPIDIYYETIEGELTQFSAESTEA